MKPIQESVVAAMDGQDIGLYPFLPYILQDLWEIGANPEAIIKLIKKHATGYTALKILDLGCGKGAVSVKLSGALRCKCHGIDAIPEFIAFAIQKADEYNVDHLCTFKTGDIRIKVNGLYNYDIIILGAIGPVFGDYYSTLTTLSTCINKNGMFIIDDGYIENNSKYSHPLILKKNIILQQINMAGMELIDDDIMHSGYIKNSNDAIFYKMKRRCYELMEKYPDKQNLFLNYVKKQEEENYTLENKVTGTTMVIKRKN